LVAEFNHETTLYNQTLIVEVQGGKHRAKREWHELVYELEANRERYEIQQRVWRRGRGEETEADLRAEDLAERIGRFESGDDEPRHDYEWS